MNIKNINYALQKLQSSIKESDKDSFIISLKTAKKFFSSIHNFRIMEPDLISLDNYGRIVAIWKNYGKYRMFNITFINSNDIIIDFTVMINHISYRFTNKKIKNKKCLLEALSILCTPKNIFVHLCSNYIKRIIVSLYYLFK